MKKVKLSQFYTNDDIVEKLLNTLDLSKFSTIIEPSAGTGAFYNKIDHDHKIGLDIDPKCDGIISMDYFDFVAFSNNILVVGNPPFGKNSSLARKFFNHSAKFADVIAFILPRTFLKPSMINTLDNHFHLSYSEDLPSYSFHLENGKLYDVPCVWQIWEIMEYTRGKIKVYKTHPDFDFVGREDADFIIQRVGVRAGKISKDFHKAKSSHYFIKGDKEVFEIMNKINWEYSSKYDTVGNPSISKNDVVLMYKRYKDLTYSM